MNRRYHRVLFFALVFTLSVSARLFLPFLQSTNRDDWRPAKFDERVRGRRDSPERHARNDRGDVNTDPQYWGIPTRPGLALPVAVVSDPFRRHPLRQFCQQLPSNRSECRTAPVTTEQRSKGYSQLSCSGRLALMPGYTKGERRTAWVYSCAASGLARAQRQQGERRRWDVYLPPSSVPQATTTKKEDRITEIPVLMDYGGAEDERGILQARVDWLGVNVAEELPTSKVGAQNEEANEMLFEATFILQRGGLGRPNTMEGLHRLTTLVYTLERLLPDVNAKELDLLDHIGFVDFDKPKASPMSLADALDDSDIAGRDGATGGLITRNAVIGLDSSLLDFEPRSLFRPRAATESNRAIKRAFEIAARAVRRRLSDKGHIHNKIEEDREGDVVCFLGGSDSFAQYEDLTRAFERLQGVRNVRKVRDAAEGCGLVIFNRTSSPGESLAISQALLSAALADHRGSASPTFLDASSIPSLVLSHIFLLLAIRYAALSQPSLHLSFPHRGADHLLSLISLSLPSRHAAQKHLVYMPWEQLNNQLIEFRGACAAAVALDRTLVLPKVGHRRPGGNASAWKFSFDVGEYQWEDWDRYFDAAPHLSVEQTGDTQPLPCATLDFHNLVSLHAHNPSSFSFGTLLFNPVSSGATMRQLPQYYSGVLGVPWEHTAVLSPKWQWLDDAGIRRRAAEVGNPRILSLGATFWIHGLGRGAQSYPLKSYADYTNLPLYRQIVRGVQFRPDIAALAEWVAGHVATQESTTQSRTLTAALHLRLGDYAAKCGAIRDAEARAHCMPSTERVAEALSEAVQAHLNQLTGNGQVHVALFVATNTGARKGEFDYLAGLNGAFGKWMWRTFPPVVLADLSSPARHGRVQFQSDSPRGTLTIPHVLPSDLARRLTALDPVERVLLDVEACVAADIFVGNHFSSLSRTVMERRKVEWDAESSTF